ncbi:hypothetical protein GCM10009609_13840 [Pseudonocardia aurantiaca]|uniref:DUF1508 domain-containing protein n=1 Tax=Pseudonocardia aurantiaca TaxID=75290 RepID=A0ABW4FEZ7_9PSEU
MRAPWDTKVVFIERRRCWWWNAWRESTATELYGFSDSQETASRAMFQAIEQAGPSPAPLAGGAMQDEVGRRRDDPGRRPT